jgi:ArsR family transcriptional regulator
MPVSFDDLMINTPTVTAKVALEPAQNLVHSLFMLAKHEPPYGAGEWILRTSEALPAEMRNRLRVVLIGLFYVAAPERSFSSFPAYIDYLSRADAVQLRDKMLDTYLTMPCWTDLMRANQPEHLKDPDKEQVLSSWEYYREFLLSRFGKDNIDREVESQAYELALRPEEMKRYIISVMREMWDKYLREEWERARPMLQDSLRAFRQVDLSGLSNVEAAKLVTGQERLTDHLESLLEKAEQVIFVPSTHVGPYIGSFKGGDTLWVIFGARIPRGVEYDAPDLSRAEILTRLNALTDDSRLRILKMVAEQGELRSQDIMQALDLSQSAASRHLSQLAATGYLSERRCEGAKCYSLVPDRIEDTLQAVRAFLLDAAKSNGTGR